jgi:hypothetical protein
MAAPQRRHAGHQVTRLVAFDHDLELSRHRSFPYGQNAANALFELKMCVSSSAACVGRRPR